MKSKTRRVKPPTRLLRLIMLLVFPVLVSSCSLFKVYAGKVEYSDPQHNFMMSVDTLHAERPIKQKLYQPVTIKPLKPF